MQASSVKIDGSEALLQSRPLGDRLSGNIFCSDAIGQRGFGSMDCPGSVAATGEKAASLDQRARRAPDARTHIRTPRECSCGGASLSASWKDIARKSMASSEQLKRDCATAFSKH